MCKEVEKYAANKVAEAKMEEKIENVIGMIKDDKHRTRGIIDLNEQEIDLREDKNNRRLFKLITELQDEVHRFVITYHRSLRDKIK